MKTAGMNTTINFRILILLLLIICFSVVLAACAQLSGQENDAQLSEQELIARGTQHYEKDQYSQSVACFTKALAQNPLQYEALVGRAKAYYYLDQKEAALADLNGAIAINSEGADAYAWRAHIWYRDEDYEKALSDGEKALRLDPCEKVALLYRGNALREMGDTEGAIKEYSKIAECGHGTSKVYAYRGYLNYLMDSYAKAAEDCSKAFELNPGDLLSLEGRADAHRELGKYDLAIMDYSEVIRISPNLNYVDDLEVSLDTENALLGRARSYWKIGDHERALDDLDRSLELCQDCYREYQLRGMVQQDLGNFNAALSDFTEAFDIDHTNAIAYALRGNLFRKMSQYGKALADYEMVIKIDPDNPKLLSMTSVILITCPDEEYRDAKRALELINQAIEKEEDKAFHYMILAAAHANLGSFEDAIEAQEKALQLELEVGKSDNDIKLYQDLLQRYRKKENPWPWVMEHFSEEIYGVKNY